MNQEELAGQVEGEMDQEALSQEQQLLYDQQMQEGGFMSDTFSNVAQGLTGSYRNIMMQYWQDTIDSIENNDHEFKQHQLPLARIKKVMKADEDVKMISAEAPILFAKGCDIFITELTMRAWIHAEENKRRTLQRSDIASALQKSDMFDFLIDIVPREEALSSSSSAASRKAQAAAAAAQAQAEAQAQAQAQAQQGEIYQQQQQQQQQQQYDEEEESGAVAGEMQQAQDAAGIQLPQPLDGEHQVSHQYVPAGQPAQPGQQIYGELDSIYNGYREY